MSSGPAQWLSDQRTRLCGRAMAGSAVGDHVYEHFGTDGAEAATRRSTATGGSRVGKGLRVHSRFPQQNGAPKAKIRSARLASARRLPRQFERYDVISATIYCGTGSKQRLSSLFVCQTSARRAKMVIFIPKFGSTLHASGPCSRFLAHFFAIGTIS